MFLHPAILPHKTIKTTKKESTKTIVRREIYKLNIYSDKTFAGNGTADDCILC